MESPYELRILMYNVGFGDCFLLTFRYRKASPAERHVLIDFGSTAGPLRQSKFQMENVAKEIRKITGGRLDAVVVTHRHADHISGFTTRKGGGGPGDIIRSISANALVVQPWTEDPQLPVNARSRAVKGAKAGGKGLSALHVRSLDSMHGVAKMIVGRLERLAAEEMDAEDDADEAETPHNGKAPASAFGVGPVITARLAFLGQTNLKNLPAVKNLQSMGKAHEYLSHGSRTALEGKVLPGVKVHVFGPPTLEEHPEAAKYAKESDEYWNLQAAAMRVSTKTGDDKLLFPNEDFVQGDELPKSVRWFARKLRAVQAQQLFELVRIIDNTMNNTSLILMFEVGGKLLLFPGDAQLENWDFALNVSKRKAANRKLLRNASLYKVGHHGSLNATPKSLWALFKNKPKIVTLLSTRPGKHGSTKAHTEVPRKTLSEELVAHSDFHTTTDCTSKTGPACEVIVKFPRRRR